MTEVLIGGGHLSTDTHKAKTMDRHGKKKILSDINNHTNTPILDFQSPEWWRI